MPRSALAVGTHENWLEQHRYLNMDELREHKKEGLRHGPLLSPLGQLLVPPGQSTLRRARRLMVRYGSARRPPAHRPSFRALQMGHEMVASDIDLTLFGQPPLDTRG